MYGFHELNELTPDQILQKVSQEQIIEFILKESFDIASRYISPFRDDENPKCRFEQRPDGTIVFVDFGDTERTHRNCFLMVMDRYNISLKSAIELICSKFNLSTSTTDYKEVSNPIQYERKADEEIFKTKIEFNKIIPIRRDILYWSKFVTTMRHLEEDSVYCTNKLTIEKRGKKKSSFKVYGLCYAIDFIDSVKIYQPYSEDYRFITNCNTDHVGNIDNLPPSGDVLDITKSYKDHRVLRNMNLGLNVIWFQNEGMIPSISILINLISRFKKIRLFFDNDEPGIRAAMKIASLLRELKANSVEIVVIPYKFGWKDPAQFVEKEGRGDLVKTLKQLGYE